MFISIATFAQKNINNYEYIIVDNKFDFFKQPDKYQTSSLTKFLFEKEGFVTFLEGEDLPKKLLNNRCLALQATVKNASNMLTTRTIIEIRDCNNKVVFVSQEGRSKQKEFKKAYHQAIRNAFVSVKSLNYNYQPLQGSREDKVAPREVVTINNTATNRENNSARRPPEDRRNNREEGNRRDNPFNNNRIPILYAKPTNNGFQLLNAKRQVAFTLLKTNLNEVFVIKNGNGILYKQNNNWVANFYDVNGNKVVKEFDVRQVPPPQQSR